MDIDIQEIKLLNEKTNKDAFRIFVCFHKRNSAASRKRQQMMFTVVRYASPEEIVAIATGISDRHEENGAIQMMWFTGLYEFRSKNADIFVFNLRVLELLLLYFF